MQELVYVNLLEHGQDGHGVHGGDDGAEQQAGQQGHCTQVSALDLTHAEQHATDEKGVPQSAHHSEHEDGAQVLREGPYG